MASASKKTDQFFKVSRNLLNSASFRANQYKQVVQKKIDLGALQKKIEQLHSELGEAVELQYLAGQKDLLASKEVARILEKVSSLRQAAVLLEEEIELIRTETSKEKGPAEDQKPPASK